MDGSRDQYEERLKEVFESFDGSGSGSLCSEELTDLCRALQLEENTLNALLHALLHDQLSARVDFEQFKDALILVLSSSNTDEPVHPEQPDSPEVQPRFVKGSKRYGRRSAPEFIHEHAESHRQAEDKDEKDKDAQTGDDRTVPRKRERWNADLSISEEFEAEGQLHLWNPDEPTTPRSIALPLCDLEERLHNACHQLSLPINGTATMQQLHMLCQHIGIELGEDLVLCSDGNSMDVQEFVSYIINHSKPPTPSASTPYRQLKRHHSTQFDESGRRISCALSSTIGLRLFSVLDDGSGHVPVETLLYKWMEEGVDNSAEILQALDFNSEDKVNLSELTIALENELLNTKNSIHQAALVSFKAEIRHLLECVDLERREKERIRLDLDKAEKLKSQLASEVDDHHAAIERNNELNLRKLEQEYKDGMNALRAELSKEVELVQQQANQQREELEKEISKMKEEENFLREHLTLTIKENGRLEAELIDSMEKLVEAENQINKLQKSMDGVLKERFGDLDPDSAEFYQQENRLRQLRMNYEEQCRELQDRIDELEAQMEEYQTLGYTLSKRPGQSLSEELANTSPDPDSQKQQTLNMSLETEMLLEQNQREVESVRAMVYEEQRSAEEERSRLSLQHHREMQVYREEMATQLERAHKLEQELSGLHALHQQEISSFTQEAQDARSCANQLQEQLAILEEKWSACEEQSRGHADEIAMMELKHQEMLETCLQEQKERLQEEKVMQDRLAEQWEQERECLQKRHEEVFRAHLEETQQRKEQECVELERRLKEDWERERLELEKTSKETLQAVLEERRERERRFREKWDEEHALLEKEHYEVLLQRLEEERECLHAQQEETERMMMEHWERKRAQLEKQHEELLQACLEQEREKVQAEREDQERRWQNLQKEEQSRMEEAHREAMLELSAKHCEEKERLSCILENLHTDIKRERRESQFSQHLKEVEHRFCDDKECFQLDVCKLEQHYQSDTAALKQQHATDCACWEEGSDSAIQEAEQQQKLLRQVLDLERAELNMNHQQLELTYAKDIKILTDKNLQLQAELESFISAVRSKEIELSHQLNERHNHLQESMEQTKDLMLAQTEHKAAELETMLQMAVDDLIQERVELQNSLSALESEGGEGLSGSMELKTRIQESEEVLCQAAEDLRNERLEIEEKPKESISLLMAKEGERVALLAEKDTLALKVVQLEHIFAEPCTVTAVEISADTKEDLEGPTQETSKEPVDGSNEKESFINEHFKSSGGITENTSEMHIALSLPIKSSSALNIISETVDDTANPKIGVNKQVTTSDSYVYNKDTADVESNQEFFNTQILKKQNSRLRQVLADLQGKSLRIHKQMEERRSEVCRLAKENLILRHRISTVREEDLRENQENLRLQHMKQGKRAAQALRRQLSEPRRLGHHLDEENVLLQLNPDHVLRHTSQEVMLPHDHSPANEKNGLFQLFDREDFVFRKEKDLLRAELNRLIEKGMSLESSLQTLTQQNAHLKSDLRITQQERDALKQEGISLHKQMQSVNEKLLEVSVVSVGQQQGRRLWAELSGLMEAEHASLMDENQRLKRQMSEMNSELQRAREQICQLEALSLKQRALVKGADQEKSALKRELDALHSQLISSRNKTQRAALLPSSSLQLPGEQRGQHHSDGPDFSMQDEREVALLHMEDRMREVEVTLRNLKLLLQEKVSQLKEQLTRNSEAEVLIKDLYVENAQLLKALEKTEQRQKVAEKKNFLLEEKISSLNKIVRDLGPSPLTPSPYHFTRS